MCAKENPQWDCQWPLGLFCVLHVRAESTVCHLSFGQHRASQGVCLLLHDEHGLKNKTSNKRGVTVRSDLKWGEHNLLIMFHKKFIPDFAVLYPVHPLVPKPAECCVIVGETGFYCVVFELIAAMEAMKIQLLLTQLNKKKLNMIVNDIFRGGWKFGVSCLCRQSILLF